MENTEENREKLAQSIVSDWSLDDLIEYAIDRLSEAYRREDENFQFDWRDVFGEEEKN